MKKALFLLLTLLSFSQVFAMGDPARWVDPFIGTGGHGHTFPGATRPFGMVQLSPDTRIDNWDGSSGYHYSDDIIYGFSHTHLSGTGIPDYCDILFAPYISDTYFWNASPDDTKKGFASKFSHDKEIAEPGYYSVVLEDENILAEMTATERVGFHRYTFPEGTTEAKIALDLKWRDEVLNSGLKIVGDRRVEGFRRSRSWAKDQLVFFSAEFSEPVSIYSIEASGDDENVEKSEDGITTKNGATVKANFRFSIRNDKPLLLKVGISPVSIEGARKNLEAEVPHWDFDLVKKEAREAWNKELSKIEVSGGTDAEMTNFYTALYHTMIAPNIYNDVDGKYRGMDRKIYNIADGFQVPGSKFNESDSNDKRASLNVEPESLNSFRNLEPGTSNSKHYTVFSLWDTFRATHPLYTIIDEKRTVEFINTFIRQYEQGGKLPVWELAGNETDTMIGYHAVSVIADAMAKGIEGFDYEKAYEASKHSAELDIEGRGAFIRRGYISTEDEQESVSRTLEYAYNEFCVAVMAKVMLDRYLKQMSERSARFTTGWDDKTLNRYELEHSRHLRRSLYYKNLFDRQTGFMRPKQNGDWIAPFEPNDVTFHFTEGNSWQYTFFVPHDVGGLMALYGGKAEFARRLDALFTTEQKLIGREQPDITGLIGQYAHGNEPSHHIAYLYNFAGQPWKTQYYVRKIMDEFYKPEPDGLIGNEDCGQMSAWYVLSALGFYQVNPGDPEYALGTPIFKEARILLENGKTFAISKRGDGIYTGSVKLNGSPRRAARFSHKELMDGGELEFSMSRVPVKNWFTTTYEATNITSFAPVPTIEGPQVFEGSAEVDISAPQDGLKIFYTTDGTTPNESSDVYEGPFVIHGTTQIKAILVTRHARSQVVEAKFHKIPNDWAVKLLTQPTRQYTGGGPKGLVDGLRGTTNFASGEWQGFWGTDLEAVIALKRPTKISRVGGNFLQAARSWIWMPRKVIVEVSDDGVAFTKVAEIETDFPEREMEHTIREYVKEIDPVTARFVRIKAVNFGKIPSWHPGAGNEAYIFVDEVIIE